MARLDYKTAGESHGRGLIALIEGVPAGMAIDTGRIDQALGRRQKGYGRGGRQAIEEDRVQVLSGLRKSRTLGSPITLFIPNRDASLDRLPAVHRPRPGHADLAGCLKIGCRDARDILERTSARETAARTAAGAIAAQILGLFGVRVFAHVIRIGPVAAAAPRLKTISDDLVERREASNVRCLDEAASTSMREAVDSAEADGDSLGGIVEILATGLLPGVGAYDQWPNRLDTRIAGALMGIPSVKGVEIGEGFATAGKPGSQVHDEILYSPALIQDGKPHGFMRSTNRAGGIEGGMANGEPLVVRAAFKPIPTLRRALKTIDIHTGRGAEAATERSDVCAVPSAAIVAEGAVAFELARAYVEKFGGDSIAEMTGHFESYVASLRTFLP